LDIAGFLSLVEEDLRRPRLKNAVARKTLNAFIADLQGEYDDDGGKIFRKPKDPVAYEG
jgi:hypothetical protein